MLLRRIQITAYDLETLVARANSVPMPDRLRMPISVSFHPCYRPIDFSFVRVRFGTDRRIEYVVPERFPDAESMNLLTHHWLCTVELFCYAKHRYPQLQGNCDVWVGDRSHGPGLAFCGNTVSHILLPDVHYLESDAYRELKELAERIWIPWQDRRDTVFWRGASTGDRQAVFADSIDQLPRVRLCIRAQESPRADLFDVGIADIVQIWGEEREAILQRGIVKGHAPLETFMQYKHVIDVDGNASAWSGLFHRFLMGNTVIKVDSRVGFRQWYYDELIPWKNFVPVSCQMDELEEVAEWLLEHPLEAREISQRGREAALSLTKERSMEMGAARIAAYLAR